MVGETIDRKYGILSSFTNFDLLRAPNSDRIGLDAWRVLTYRVPHPGGKKRELRPLQQSSWLCDGKSVELLDRSGVRKNVLNGVITKCWAGYATTSYKKHGALRAPVNSGKQQMWLWETVLVDCTDRAVVGEYWRMMRSAQDAGIHRPLIESLDISPGYIAKLGWRRWRDFEHWARPRHRSVLYRFIVYLLPSMEELKNVADV
jgi:hypothetical protein